MDFFKLKKNGSNILTEIYSGITIFITIAYTLAVNADILSGAGMDKGAVFTAGTLACAIGTMCMGLFSNYPLVVAPQMVLNVFFTYSVSKNYGWEIALCAVLVEGIIFILLSFVNIRKFIFEAIPKNLKYAVSVGIGLFVAFIGLKNSGIAVSDINTLVLSGEINNVGSFLAVIGVIIIGIMLYYKVKGSLLWGILIVYVMGIGCELIGLYEVTDKAPSLIPARIISMPMSVENINIISAFKSIDFEVVGIFDFIAAAVSFLFIDMFCFMAVFMGISEKIGIIDEKKDDKKVRRSFLANAIGIVAGAIFGTSPINLCPENVSGAALGGRTGLTAVTAAFLFFISLFFFPVFISIPRFAVAPALIVSGILMMNTVVKIDFSDFTESIPSFLIIIMIPFTNSIVNGIVFGTLSYVVLKVLTGRKKDVNIVMYIIAFVFFIKLFVY